MKKTVDKARDLRQNQTEAEKLLWSKLRARQFHDLKFRRQHPIPPYIVDFYSDALKLIIELDGGQHNHDTDAKRSSFIEKQGMRIVRFWNNDVLSNIEGVLEELETIAMSSPPSPKPSPQGEGLNKRICIGVIAQAHGVKGLVKILPYGEDPYLIETVKEFDITLKSPHGKYFLAEIAGVSSREDVDKIKGTELFIDRSALPDPDEGEYYIEDLVGMKALNAAGKDAGVILAVHDFGAGNLLEIKPKSGETYLVPFNDEHVPEVTDESVTVIPMTDGVG